MTVWKWPFLDLGWVSSDAFFSRRFFLPTLFLPTLFLPTLSSVHHISATTGPSLLKFCMLLPYDIMWIRFSLIFEIFIFWYFFIFSKTLSFWRAGSQLRYIISRQPRAPASWNFACSFFTILCGRDFLWFLKFVFFSLFFQFSKKHFVFDELVVNYGSSYLGGHCPQPNEIL